MLASAEVWSEEELKEWVVEFRHAALAGSGETFDADNAVDCRFGSFVKSIGADVVVRGALLSVVAISADIADGVAIINADINAIAEFTLLNLPIMISVKYSRY